MFKSIDEAVALKHEMLKQMRVNYAKAVLFPRTGNKEPEKSTNNTIVTYTSAYRLESVTPEPSEERIKEALKKLEAAIEEALSVRLHLISKKERR